MTQESETTQAEQIALLREALQKVHEDFIRHWNERDPHRLMVEKTLAATTLAATEAAPVAENDYRKWADRLGCEIVALMKANPEDQAPKIISDQIMVYFNRVAPPVASGQNADWELVRRRLANCVRAGDFLKHGKPAVIRLEDALAALDRLRNAAPVQPVTRPKDDKEHAAWLADKIHAMGDYAKEAAAMLNRWPVPHDAVVPDGWKASNEGEGDAFTYGYFQGRDEALQDIIPIGWKAVPIVPTEEMVSAVNAGCDTPDADLLWTYEHWLAAAPPTALETASAVRERALEEAIQIVLRRTEIPKGAKNPTRDNLVIAGEDIAEIIHLLKTKP